LIPLVRMLDRSVPITLAESGWLGQQLPQVDKDFLHNARIECQWRWRKDRRKCCW
jgi:hypothetical protein